MPSERKPMRIQSLIFDKSKFSKDSARAWATKHGYSSEVDETGESYRMRQSDPGKFDKMRTIDLTDGVKAVVAKSHDPENAAALDRAFEKFIDEEMAEPGGHDPQVLRELRENFRRFMTEEAAEKAAKAKDSPFHKVGKIWAQIIKSLDPSAERADKSQPGRSGVHVPVAGAEDRPKGPRRIATVAIRHGAHVLMGKRRDNGKWTFPGGHVDDGEDMHAGARRELLEETGLDVGKLAELTPLHKREDGDGKPLHVQAFHKTLKERPNTSMRHDPDGEVHRWQWVDTSKGLPPEIEKNLHVPRERNIMTAALGLTDGQDAALGHDGVDKDLADTALESPGQISSAPAASSQEVDTSQDIDAETQLQPGINNLEGGILKAALGEPDNEDWTLQDLQQLVEGTDWEMAAGDKTEETARAMAAFNLETDPAYYRKKWLAADGTDNPLSKDTTETEVDPFAGEGYNPNTIQGGLWLDLGSGESREDGHIGLDLYPYDKGTVVHDLTMGLPFPDASASKIHMANAMEHMDLRDPKALFSEINRVLMPGGQFTYQGPNDVANQPGFTRDLPGLVLVDHEEAPVEKEGTGAHIRQVFTRVATPDPATANDAEPRTGVPQQDELPADALLAADAVGYAWSDATSSGRGNRMYGYPSQGAMMKALGGVKKAMADGFTVPIVKAEGMKQIVYCVALEPDTIDAQDDVMSPEDIEETAHNYLIRARVIGAGHTKQIAAVPVESFIAPQDLQYDGAEQIVKKGSWVIGIKVVDPKEWQKVLDGEYTGVSVGGEGVRE